MVEQHLVSQVVVGLNSTVTRELPTHPHNFVWQSPIIILGGGGSTSGGKGQLPLKRLCYTYNLKIAECLSLVPHTSLIASGGCARRMWLSHYEVIFCGVIVRPFSISMNMFKYCVQRISPLVV